MKNIGRGEGGNTLFREERRRLFRGETSEEVVSRSKKLQALKEENLILERRLADMVLNNRVMRSMYSSDPISDF